MPNRFIDRDDNTVSEEINENEIVSKILLEEFPNDPLLKTNRLSLVPNVAPKPVTDLAERNVATEFLEIDADVSASFAEYSLNKLVPSVDDEELDDILLDEFETYLDPDDDGFRLPVRTGLFLIAVELDSTPYDYHDLYIQNGPETIPDMVNRGVPEDELLNAVFCVWYIERNVARPIPNYKTLEVMLVERGLNYGAIAEAAQEDFDDFDMRLDGRFQKVASTDAEGNPLEAPGIYDEFILRSVLDRSHDWNTFIRARSGYRLGATSNGRAFTRDPGDYRKPNSLRETTVPSDTEIDDIINGPDFGVYWPTLPANFKVGARLYRYYKIQEPYISIDLINSDPEDLYFDTCLLPPSDIETFRSLYEGQLLLLQWPTANYVREFVENGTPNTLFDDLFFDLRFMIHGHLKQVLSLKTLKDIARLNNIDTSRYDAALEEYPVNELTGQIEGAVDELDEQQFEALRAQNGLIQILAEQEAITVLGDSRVDTGIRRIWDEFGQIANVDRLDSDEYERYKTYESNGLNMFGREDLIPYEPPGSLVYYPQERYAILQEQALEQEAFDQAVILIREIFPPLATKAAEFSSKLAGLSSDFVGLLEEKLGVNSPIYSILSLREGNGSTNIWKLEKRKSSGAIKDKGSNPHFFRLCEVRERIFKYSMNKREENRVFIQGGNFWMINTNTVSDNARGQVLLNQWGPDSAFPLINDAAKEAMRKAKVGSTPKWKVGDNGTARRVNGGSNNQRYGRPERAGSRVRQQMKDPEYFRACIAQYVLEHIIDPASFSNPNDLPDDVINGTTGSSLYSLCVAADDFLSELTALVADIEEYISDIDLRIINATTAEEVLDIYNFIVESRDQIDSFNEDYFTYLQALNDYIVNKEQYMGKRIVNAIQKVRKAVNEKNKKYYIRWPSANQNVASLYVSSGFTDNQPDNV